MFSILEESKTYQVTFGDGVQGNVIDKGNINHSGALNLIDVKLVEGLSTNLISVSQLYDQDSENHTIMTGTRLSDNYYHWDKNIKNLMYDLLKYDEGMPPTASFASTFMCDSCISSEESLNLCNAESVATELSYTQCLVSSFKYGDKFDKSLC